MADVKANKSKVYLVFYNNDKALVTVYNSNLKVQGEMPGVNIENGKISIALHPNSGHFDQLTLKNKPEFPLFHRMETNGATLESINLFATKTLDTHCRLESTQAYKSDFGPGNGCY